MEECYQTINMSANQPNPRRRGNTDIKWTVVVVVVVVVVVQKEVKSLHAFRNSEKHSVENPQQV